MGCSKYRPKDLFEYIHHLWTSTRIRFLGQKKLVVFQVPCQKKTGSVGRLYFFFFFLLFFMLTIQNSSFPLLQKSTGNVIRLWILVICTMADVVVLNLCTLALQTLDCRVLSGNNNHNKFILFQRQRRPEYIKC